MTNSELINIMMQNRLMQSKEEVVAFDEALSTLDVEHNPKILSTVFLVFDDACEHEEIMWGLTHYVETFSTEIEAQALFEALPEMIDVAQEWSEIILGRLIASEKDRLYIKTLISTLSPDVKEKVFQCLKRLSTHGEKAKQWTNFLMT